MFYQHEAARVTRHGIFLRFQVAIKSCCSAVCCLNTKAAFGQKLFSPKDTEHSVPSNAGGDLHMYVLSDDHDMSGGQRQTKRQGIGLQLRKSLHVK